MFTSSHTTNQDQIMPNQSIEGKIADEYVPFLLADVYLLAAALALAAKASPHPKERLQDIENHIVTHSLPVFLKTAPPGYGEKFRERISKVIGEAIKAVGG